MIEKALFDFLKDLKANNNRDWFTANKTTFKSHEMDAKAFFKSVHEGLNITDEIERNKIMRIYRDVRFSKDKTPYNPRFAGNFSRATASLRGGYFLNIQPGNSIVGGGFYSPNSDDLKRIRQEFETDDSEIRAVLNNAEFKTTFGTIQGAELKTAPRGFNPENKAIDLIRKKQFYVIRNFTDKEVQSKDFKDQVLDTYRILRPYFDYMSSILTTNLNGESII